MVLGNWPKFVHFSWYYSLKLRTREQIQADLLRRGPKTAQEKSTIFAHVYKALRLKKMNKDLQVGQRQKQLEIMNCRCVLLTSRRSPKCHLITVAKENVGLKIRA